MTRHSHWWQEVDERSLADIIATVNYARSQRSSVSECDALCKALNKIWNCYYAYRETNGLLVSKELENAQSKKGRSDNQSIGQLLLTGLGDGGETELCISDAICAAAKFLPSVMNMHTLMKSRYDPMAITPKQRKSASKEHDQFRRAYENFEKESGSDKSKQALLKKAAVFIYTVRSNIAHCEKTPQGPDLDKVNRDRAVSKVASGLIGEVLAVLFDRPDTRLAVYGTLAPGEPNHCILKEVSGEWITGHITGRIHKENGLPKFHWDLSGDSVPVHLLRSSSLPGFFPRLDDFEGRGYRRSWIPVTCPSGPLLSTVYQAKDESDLAEPD